MTIHHTLRAAAAGMAALAAVTVGVLLPGTASADVRTVTDAKHDVDGGADIWRTTVTHEKRVRVAIKFDDIVRSYKSDAGALIYVDTDETTAGPDFVLSTPLFSGSDYALFRTEGWKSVGEPLTCWHNVALDFQADVATVAFGRGCLGNPDAVRVAVKAVSGTESGRAIDWLGARRQLTPWVAQG